MTALTKQVLDQLEKVLITLEPEINTTLKNTRDRMDIAYAALQGDADRAIDTLKGQIANASGDLTKIANTEIPLTDSMVDTTVTYLASTFLSGYPIFPVTAQREKEDSAAQLTVLTERDQVRFGWAAELNTALYSLVAYPYGVVEVLWKEKRGNSAAIRQVDGQTVPVAAPVVYAGNSIESIDPYNAFGDFSVAPYKVHSEGGYAGKVERLSYIQMKRRIYDWDEAFIYKDNISKIFKYAGVSNPTFYKKHKSTKDNARNSVNPGTNGRDWSSIFVQKPGEVELRPEFYEIVTIYYRLCPEDFGATKSMIQNPGAPTVFQLIWVNGRLCVAKPLVSGHEYLPMIFGKYRNQDLNSKTLTEKQAPFQYVVTALMNGSLASVRKAVAGGDRYYNTKLISGDVLNTFADRGLNVPVTPPGLAQNFSIKDAVFQVPYVDTVSQTVLPLLNSFIALGEKVQGINSATQGNFVKGNRTRSEFDSIQNNSQSRLGLGALTLDSTFFGPIKEIIKLNYLIYAAPEDAASSPNSENSRAIDPATLREEAPEYKFGDGFLPTTKIQNTESALLAMQYLMQFPDKIAEYDVGAIAVSALKQFGFTGLNNYKRTPEQTQQYVDQQAQINGTGNQTQAPTA